MKIFVILRDRYRLGGWELSAMQDGGFTHTGSIIKQCEIMSQYIFQYSAHMQNPREAWTEPFAGDDDDENPSFVLRLYSSPQDGWMGEQFNNNSICPSLHQILQVSDLNLLFREQFTEILTTKAEASPSAVPNTRKSLFQNFQKHLLTLIKRQVCFEKKEFNRSLLGGCAQGLWRAFLKCRYSPKKTLCLFLGVKGKTNQNDLSILGSSVPQLQRLMSKYDRETIRAAQEILRGMVHRKASLLSKEQLQSGCKIHRFELFYSYFGSFLEELCQGAISRRISKQHIRRLTQLLPVCS